MTCVGGQLISICTANLKAEATGKEFLRKLLTTEKIKLDAMFLRKKKIVLHIVTHSPVEQAFHASEYQNHLSEIGHLSYSTLRNIFDKD